MGAVSESKFDVDAIKKALGNLEKKFADADCRKAMRVGAKIIQQAMIEQAPVDSGALRQSIKVRSLKRKKGRIGAMVTMRADSFKGDTFYAGFVEYGHKVGKRAARRARGKVRASKVAAQTEVQGTHWAKNAFESAKEKAIEGIRQSLAESLERRLNGNS
jgi:HK97 gp10 family phage protein